MRLRLVCEEPTEALEHVSVLGRVRHVAIVAGVRPYAKQLLVAVTQIANVLEIPGDERNERASHHRIPEGLAATLSHFRPRSFRHQVARDAGRPVPPQRPARERST